jgi:hypothetical protein
MRFELVIRRGKSRGRSIYCPNCDDYHNHKAKTCPYCRTEKECPICHVVKPLKGGFYPRPEDPDGYNSRCIECFRSTLHIWHTYGITKEQYDAMLAEQDGKCAICRGGNGGQRFHVDHNHLTAVVRGLLCFHCNQGLGSFRDDANFLRLAIDYLEKETAA